MRLALVSQEYPPETAKGGIGTQTYLKAHGLAALGHEVTVVSRLPGDDPLARREGRDGSVRVIRVRPTGALPIYSDAADWVTYSASVASEVAALNAERAIDVVDFPEWAAEGYIHLLNQTEWNRIPTAVQLHGPLVMFAHEMGWPDRESEFYRSGTAMEAACVRLADAVFSSSACSAEWCSRHYLAQARPIPVLHTGVDTRRFAPRAVPKTERPTIVFVGKLAPNKGVLDLVDAAAALATEIPDLRLQLVGRATGAMEPDLRRRADQAGAPDLLVFEGFVEQDRLPDLFSRAHLFAMPSHYEPGPGLVYLEAMACGLPVVACSGAGAAEVVTDGVTGLLAPPRSPPALAQALRALLVDPARRVAMGAAARRYVLAEADSELCIRRLETFYAEVAQRNGRTLDA